MKSIKFIFNNLLFLTFTFQACFIFSNDITNEQNIQQLDQKANTNINKIASNNPQLLLHFFKQPKYTRASMICFFKHTYNNNLYAEKFLAFNFSHLKTLLSFSNESNTPRIYIEAVLSLFRQKIKETRFINAYAFLSFIQEIPELLSPYFDLQKEAQEKKLAVKNCVCKFLTERFDELKENPDKSLDILSEEIIDVVDNKNSDLSILKLQQSTMLFLEKSISSLIWSPKDNKEVWYCVKQIANELEALFTKNIITDKNALNELYKTLVEEFCYFLNESATKLNEDFFEFVKAEISQGNINFLELKEREFFVKTKLERLQNVLINAEAISKAYRSGLIADGIY